MAAGHMRQTICQPEEPAWSPLIVAIDYLAVVTWVGEMHCLDCKVLCLSGQHNLLEFGYAGQLNGLTRRNKRKEFEKKSLQDEKVTTLLCASRHTYRHPCLTDACKSTCEKQARPAQADLRLSLWKIGLAVYVVPLMT